MRVRAVAAASAESNAIGAFVLECTSAGLLMEHHGVGAFSAGYVPGSLTRGTRVIVPWERLLRARVGDGHLSLEVDAALTPHSRLTLTRFELGDGAAPAEVARQRTLLLGFGGVAALVCFTATALSVSRVAPDAGALAALAVGGLGGGLLLLAALVAARWAPLGGLPSEDVRRHFVEDLRAHTPLVVVEAGAAPKATPELPLDFERFLPRTAVGTIVVLTSLLLATLLSGRWLVAPSSGEVAVQEARPTVTARPQEARPAAVSALPAAPPPSSNALSAASATPTVTPTAEAVRGTESCRCDRFDSLLWSTPLPRLVTLVLLEQRRLEGKTSRMTVEVAVVNAGDRDLSELTLQLPMSERATPTSAPTITARRGVYFAGPLTPGQAVKWRVEGQGTEYRIEHTVGGELDDSGANAAPVNRVAELLRANHRPVRLFGAALLAWLRDPRAREAAAKLREAQREEEAAFLERVLAATADVGSCEWRLHDQALEACVHNRGATAVARTELAVRGLDAPLDRTRPLAPAPTLLVERTVTLADPLPPSAGRRVKVPLPARPSAAPLVWELTVSDQR